MPENKATLTISFDEGADSSLVAVAMLDDEKNVDASGATKTNFTASDRPYFLVHLDPALQIRQVRCSSGSARALGTVTRKAEAQIDVAEADETTELQYIPAGNPSASWYGNTPRMTRNGRTITWGEPLPAAGSISYRYSAYSYQYTPPAGLRQGEAWRTHIVIHVTERRR